MIFVTVGTHEQQFNRLVSEIDQLRNANVITEDVFIQTGYSDYKPRYCEWKKIIGFEEMQAKMNEARLVITHGGPSSFMEVIATGKIPFVVPRQYCYAEHVNNHQVDFCRSILARGYNILLVEEIGKLKFLLEEDIGSWSIKSNNKNFNRELQKIITSPLEVSW